VLWWAAVVGQAYTCLYFLFFFGLVLAAAALWALALAEPRARLVRVLRAHWLPLAVTSGVAVLLLIPLLQHFLVTAHELGMRRYRPETVPRIGSWLLMGTPNLLYGWIESGSPLMFAGGVGFVTLAAAVVGLAGSRRLSATLIGLATLSVIALATMVGGRSLWELVHAHVPGAGGIRAIGRVTIVLVVPAMIGLALVLQRLRGRNGLLVLVALACLAEQVQVGGRGWIEKDILRRHVTRLARRVDPSCEAFFLACTRAPCRRYADDDAAWVELATGIPTINGRYGNWPRGWELRQDWEDGGSARRARLRQGLDRWIAARGLDADRVCWLEYGGAGLYGDDGIRGLSFR
jgi:hypothetical protein